VTRSIAAKFMIAFVAVSLISTLLVVGFTRWRSREEFRSFLIDQNRPSLVGAFSSYYRDHGSWAGIGHSDFLSHQDPAAAPAGEADAGPFTLVDASTRQVVLAGRGYHVGAVIPPTAVTGGIPIQEDGQTVGVLLINRPVFRISAPGSAYLDRINLQTVFGGLLAVGVAVILALVLARTLTRPIRELTNATQVVSGGAVGHQVPVRSKDELGQLASSFNVMSADLVRSMELRRQMTADIAHELRTPISVILGHAEAVHDGVLPPTTETFEIIREESQRLERLVEDLRTLSMADAGELQLMLRPTSPGKLLAEAQKVYAHQAATQQVTLELQVAPDLPDVDADPQRMKEVFTNILDNALRYTPSGGKILLSAQAAGDRVEFRIQDTGPGLPADELGRIFDRFHRVQTARSRVEGGSGLGLAIAKSIVERHQGTIAAESEPGSGLGIVLQLPRHIPPDAGPPAAA
jgi:two-component system sensor histidine kinase BaeS